MRKLIVLLLVTILFQTFSQSTWQPMMLTVAGYNTIEGIEGWYSLESCSGDHVILIRFTNNNVSPVTLSWYDGIFTFDTRWIYPSGQARNRSVTVPAGGTVTGTCSEHNALRLPLSGTGVSQTEVYRYKAMELEIIF